MANKVTRSSLLSGPGSLKFGDTNKYFAKEAINAAINLETFQPEISTHGKGAHRISDATGEIKFTPSGRITAALLADLWPAAFRLPVVGSRVFPAADVPLLIHAMDGTQLTFANVAVTGMPELTLSPAATAIGEATFTALIKDNTERSTVGSMYSIGAVANWSEDFDDCDIICVPYAGVWGSQNLPTKEGWRVAFEVETEPVVVDGVGTVDLLLKGVTATATCTPLGWSAQDLLEAVRPEGLALGSSLRQSKDLVITGAPGGYICTLYDTVVVEGSANYHPTDPRVGEVAFVSSRNLSGTAPNTTMGAVFALDIAGA